MSAKGRLRSIRPRLPEESLLRCRHRGGIRQKRIWRVTGNHATFPNCLCDNSFSDATYDEVYSSISNTVHINGFRCRRACSVPSLMFHRVNRTKSIPKRVVRSGWARRRFPAGGFREGDPFCGPVAMRLGVWWVSERSSFGAQPPLGAKILLVEQTIRRWRIGTGQHAS